MSGMELRVLEGTAPSPVRRFLAGSPEGPLGVGTAGEWIVGGAHVAPVHAYLYFDGTTLMVATAQAELPTMVNGSEVTADWCPLEEGAEVRLGAVVLVAAAPFGDEATSSDGSAWQPPVPIDEAKTAFFDASAAKRIDAPAPPRTSRSGGPSRRSAGPRLRSSASPLRPGEGSDATRFLPIEQMRRSPDARESMARAAPEPPPPQPLPPQPAFAPPPEPPAAMASYGAPLAPMPSGQQMPPPTTQGAPPPVMIAPQALVPGSPNAITQPSRGGESALLKAWKEASPPRRALYVLLPIALVAFAFTMFDDEPAQAPPRRSKKPAAAQSASAKPAASAPDTASSAPPLTTVTGVLLPPGGPPAPGSAPPAVRGAPPPKTVERQAADAMAAGSYAEATRLYEQLAHDNPDVPAYREALRILRAKAGGAPRP